MMNIEKCKKVFDEHGGMVQSKHLQEAKIFYRQLQKLIEQGYVEKIRYGYYRWVDHDDFSEVGIVIRLFPDAILCMDTALRHYGYSDRTPCEWHLAVSKYSGRSRFKIDYPFVKPYYVLVWKTFLINQIITRASAGEYYVFKETKEYELLTSLLKCIYGDIIKHHIVVIKFSHYADLLCCSLTRMKRKVF